MLLALGGDGRNGNREESAEKTERVGRETESAVKILEELLIFGYRKNASDIHMEPWEDRFVIRMRIDGMMTMVREFDKSMYQPLVTRAKVISGMDIAKKRVPQDGHFRETIKGIRLDMRTSVIPTIFGEKMVLRFLDRKTEIDHCGTFVYGDNVFEKHGINRDRTGDREKTRYLCGKQGIFTRDRALIRPGSIRQLETRASTRSASFFHALGGPGRPYNGGGAAGAYRTHNGAKPLKQGHLRAKRGPLGPSRKSQQQTKRTGFAAHGHSIAETAPEGKRASRANGALIRA